jgi:hypothetical protein
VKSDLVKQELLRIAEAHGGKLRPIDVVAAARPKSSPLHSKFQWDDTKAAESYRLWQARQLIKVVVEKIVGSLEPQQIMVSLTPDRKLEGGGYRILTDVLGNRPQREQLLADALLDMERFQQKYAVLKELADVFAAMRKVKQKRKAVAA